MTATLLALHAFGVSCMAGIGGFVQWVHYPGFADVDRDRWAEFHAAHSRRTAWVVAVPWAIEGVTAVVLVFARPAGVPGILPVCAVVLAGLTVVATVGLALPAHSRLADGYSAEVHSRLVRTNWIRTLAWLAGAIVAALMIVEYANR